MNTKSTNTTDQVVFLGEHALTVAVANAMVNRIDPVAIPNALAHAAILSVLALVKPGQQLDAIAATAAFFNGIVLSISTGDAPHEELRELALDAGRAGFAIAQEAGGVCACPDCATPATTH